MLAGWRRLRLGSLEEWPGNKSLGHAKLPGLSMSKIASTLVLSLALMLGGCFAARQPNASGFTNEQQTYFDFFTSQGFSKEKANLLAVSPVARQLYFDDQKCLSYGAKSGSDAYVSCRPQLEASQN
jgi:hypothetical protein